MGLLDAFKRKGGENVPPDIGQEVPDVVQPAKGNVASKKVVKKKAVSVGTSKPVVKKKSAGTIVAGERDSFEFEKINVKLQETGERIAQFNERISSLDERMGEVRAMNLSNEKKIVSSMKEATKVVEMFNEVKPQNLRLDYQKMDIRLKKLEEKMSGYRQLVDSVTKDFAALAKKAEAFRGTEGLIKLNQDLKKDFVEIQKLSEKSRMYSDQVKEIFLELKSSFAESKRIDAMVSNLNESFSSLREDLEKLKITQKGVVKHEDYADFKKTYNTKLAGLNQTIMEVESLKETLEGMNSLVEESISISKQNSEDINNIAVGGGETKRINEYENQIADLVEIVEKLVNQVAELRGNTLRTAVSSGGAEASQVAVVPRTSLSPSSAFAKARIAQKKKPVAKKTTPLKQSFAKKKKAVKKVAAVKKAASKKETKKTESKAEKNVEDAISNPPADKEEGLAGALSGAKDKLKGLFGG